jgi:hypothetical protein
LREAAETSVTDSCRVTSRVRPPPASMEAAHGDGPAWLAEQPRRGCVLGIPWRSGLLNLAHAPRRTGAAVVAGRWAIAAAAAAAFVAWTGGGEMRRIGFGVGFVPGGINVDR